jgi:hypothetical protein
VTSLVVARLPRRAPAPTCAAVVAALIVMGAVTPVARAQGCAGAEPRLSFVRERLHADAHDARVWAWSWGVGFTALALGQAGLALTRSDRGERAELYVGAGKTVLGLVPVLFVPVPAGRDVGALDARLTATNGDEGEARCALLPEAEVMLQRSADDEAFGRSWLAHAATVAVNAGGLLIVGFGYHRWTTGTLGAVVGTAVGELQIFTRPTGALDARRGRRWAVAPLLDRDAAGLRIAVLLDP